MYKQPDSPQPIGGVLDNGFSLYRHSLKGTFLFAFVGSLLSAPVGRVAPTPGAPADFGLIATLLTLSLVTFVLSLVIWGAIIARIHAVQHGESLTAREAVAVGLRRFPVMLGVVLLAMLMLGVGFLLLVIPGIYLLVRILFAPFAAITESKGVTESIRYSFELTRGRWWRTFLLVTIVSIVVSVLYAIVIVVVGAFGGAELDELERLPWQFDFVVMPLLGGLLAPLSYALIMAIYADYKLRSEGADIAERIAAAEA